MSLAIYFTFYVLDMFRTLIYPSSGAYDCAVELPHWSYCSWFYVGWSFCMVGLEWYPYCRLKLQPGWVGVVSVLQAEASAWLGWSGIRIAG